MILVKKKFKSGITEVIPAPPDDNLKTSLQNFIEISQTVETC